MTLQLARALDSDQFSVADEIRELRQDEDTKAPLAQSQPTEPTPDEIAAEAYARYLSRGGEDGHDQEDWFAAEESLRQRRS